MKLTYRTVLPIVSFMVLSAFMQDKKPRIFLIGDSTIANKRAEVYPETGWGMIFPQFIHADVVNCAVNGRSTKSFRTLGHWTKVEEQLKPGDWVFIQFGHNDQKIDDTVRYAAAQTDYRKNLIRYIKEIRAKGALPLLITPVMRRKFDDAGNFVDQHGEYPDVVRDVATKEHVPLIDLHAKSKVALVQHGVEDSKRMFLQVAKGVTPNYPEGKEDNTHFSPYGATVMASLVAAGIRDLNNDLTKYLTPSTFGDKYVYELPRVMDVVFRKDTFNISAYGARPDGATINSEAINKAIEACTNAGGGTVLVEKGFWLTGPIHLKSNVNLHLMQGALLQFTDVYDSYKLIRTNWEGLDAIRCESPISGTDLVNVAITGEGILDGAGSIWRPIKKNKLTASEWNRLTASGKGVLNDEKDTWYPTTTALAGSKVKRPGVVAEGYTLENTAAIKEFLRPNMLSFVRCKQILLEGVTFQNSPAWCLHPLLSEHLTLRNLTVRNPWNAQNGDGVDFESCRNVLVENSTFDVGDDGICIKSGRDEEGRKRGVPTENVIIRNCTVFHGHGGFVIGSEMSGGVKNIFVENCNFLGTDVGLRFKTTRGRGGVVENIYVNNINMTNIVGEGIIFDMYYAGKDPVALSADGQEVPLIAIEPVTEGTPQFNNFNISGVICKGAETAIMIKGLPEMNVKNINISKSVFQSNQGMVCIEGSGITLNHVAFHCNADSTIKLQDSKDIRLDGIDYNQTNALLSVNGKKSKNIMLINTDISKSQHDVVMGKDVDVKAVQRK